MTSKPTESTVNAVLGSTDNVESEAEAATNLVPTNLDPYQRPVDYVEAADINAALHWDVRVWRSR